MARTSGEATRTRIGTAAKIAGIKETGAIGLDGNPIALWPSKFRLFDPAKSWILFARARFLSTERTPVSFARERRKKVTKTSCPDLRGCKTLIGNWLFRTTKIRTLWAQSVEKTDGTISEFGPDTIGLRAAGSRDPVRYISSRTTTYVDEAGVPVLSIDLLKPGVTVTMYYSRVGDHLVASCVVVHESTGSAPAVEEKTTTTAASKE